MLISWEHKFLFIHNPKTAGTSLTRALLPYARREDRRAYRLHATPIVRRVVKPFLGGEDFFERATGFKPHAWLRSFENTFGRERAEDITKIIFVRNPYSQAYSLYQHIMRNSDHHNHDRYRALSIDRALRAMIDEKPPTQSAYVRFLGERKISADFIGHTETVATDTATLFAKLNLPVLNELPKLNQDPTQTPDYGAMFAKHAHLFIDYFREDFENFGYSFDPGDAGEPPSLTEVKKDNL